MKDIKICAIDGTIHISTEEFKEIVADIRENSIEEFAKLVWEDIETRYKNDIKVLGYLSSDNLLRDVHNSICYFAEHLKNKEFLRRRMMELAIPIIVQFDKEKIMQLCEDSYEQGRADAIEEVLKIADCSHTDCWDCAFADAELCKLQMLYKEWNS